MIVTITSGKGGSSKTKTTASLTRALFTIGTPPTATIDADYGASLTRLYGYRPTHPVLVDLMDGKLTFEQALHETADEVPLIPGTPALAQLPTNRELLLRWRDRFLELGTDRLLTIDTSDDIASVPVASAILAADVLVIPLQLDGGDYDRTYPEISGILAAFDHHPEEVWIAAMADGRTIYEKRVAQRLADDGREISVRIPRSIAVREAELSQRSVVGALPKAKVTQAYLDLANVVLARMRRRGYTAGKKAKALRETRGATVASNA